MSASVGLENVRRSLEDGNSLSNQSKAAKVRQGAKRRVEGL